MTLLWQKDATTPNEAIQRFVAGGDVVLDRVLFVHDIVATGAHVRGLARIGVLGVEEAAEIGACLDDLRGRFERGEFVLDERYEDGHSAIEAFVTERLGDAGKRLHTGRSRNDQVQVALRLYMRAALDRMIERATTIAEAFLVRAGASASTPMPGYTHLQRAVPSSVGHWFAGFAEAFIDDRDLLVATRSWVSSSPLGTGAGFGVNVPLDREGVARDLGFERVQLNPQYVQNSRGKFELAVLHALGQALLDVRRFAWDLSLYTTAEYGFVKLPASYTTGSSLMPQKRNPDVVELLRAAHARTLGAHVEISGVLSLPSGYQRDLQATKGPLIAAVEHGLAALTVVPGLIDGLVLDEARMRAAITPDMYATDRALELALGGVPFREAYREVGNDLGAAEGRTPEASIAARVSLGGCAALGLETLRERLARDP